MDEFRRSNRSRKAVDYAKFGADESDDEDFKAASPPKKRAKQSKGESKAPNEKGHRGRPPKVPKQQENVTDEKPAKRLPVTEKVFQRDLKAALELSKQGASAKEDTGGKETKPAKDALEEDNPSDDDEHNDKESASGSPKGESHDEGAEESETDSEDEKEDSESEGSDNTTPAKKTGKPPTKKADSHSQSAKDSGDEPEGESETDSEEANEDTESEGSQDEAVGKKQGKALNKKTEPHNQKASAKAKVGIMAPKDKHSAPKPSIPAHKSKPAARRLPSKKKI